LKKEDRPENAFNLRITAIICITLLGIPLMIGTFFGTTGLMNVGIALLTIFILAIIVLTLWKW